MGKMSRFAGLLIVMLFPVFTSLFSQPCDCISTGNCPVDIQDNGTFQGTLDVTVNGPNDLGQCPLTSICFSITHTWIGDLSVSLTSPGGDNYLVMADANNAFGGCGTQEDNVDVCITTGTGNPLTNNTEYICNSGPCQSGTCCLTGVWTMPCGGVSDPVTGASQAPNCDLNDFNTPGSPANGTWTLTVNDVCSQDVGALNNFTLNFACGTQICTVCEADGGELNADDVASCFGDPSLNLNLQPNYVGAPPNGAEYGYAYVISQNDIITAINPTSDLTAFPAGNYQVCGISYLYVALGNVSALPGQNLSVVQAELATTTAPFCADISDDCVSVIIGPPILPTLLDTMVCSGDCISIGGQDLCQSGSVTLQSWLGCDSVVNVIMIPIPPVFTTVIDTVCQGECVMVNNQLYCPPGPHVFSLDNWQGCDSTITLNFFEVITSAIINPPAPPPLSCNSPAVVLNGMTSVPANASYSWTGPGNFTSTQSVVTVSSPGTYTLTVINNAVDPPCTSSTSVNVTGNLQGPNLQVNGSAPEICAGGSFDLSTLNIVDLNGTNPAITFHSAIPATTANKLTNTTVMPAVTTTYYILGATGNCTDTDSVTLTVNPIPTADFTVVSPICIDSLTTVAYTGTASVGATYNWNFGGGTATPGTGPGPHSVEWATGGNKTITLTVSENNCTSQPASQTIAVNTQITAPVINCLPMTTSIVFTWESVIGASGYNVNVTIGPTGMMVNDTTYEVTGLNPGEQVSIFVEAISGNACGNSVTQITCTAQDCPPITVNIQPVTPFCLDGTASAIQLVATQTGGVGDGVYTFQGPGVNPITGIFNPVTADPGSHTIVVTYEEGTCLYNASRVIHVFPQPTANFTATSPVCQTNASTVNYTGNASNAATFTWNFGGGTAMPATGPGPLSVTWLASGTYTVSLMVEEDGCTSDTVNHMVEVVVPLPVPEITCVTTTETIEFIWNNLPGATGFDVNVVSGGPGTMTSDTSMLFSGLVPGDDVTLELIALDGGPCPNVSIEETCTAQDCPNTVISIDPVAAICLDASAMAFDLQATITGGDGTGTLTWSGSGITDAAAGTFDPQQANLGPNTVTALYEENNCIFTQDIVINVYAQPVAGFTAETPVCVGEISKITYTGTVQAGLTLSWDFGTATANPGTGQGPHNLTWMTPGAQPVSVTATNAQGCMSEIFTDTIQVDTSLVAPDITCVTTTTSIQFNWPDVTGATNYTAVVTAGPAGSQTSQTSYFIDGLTPNDAVTLQLTVSNNGACPPVVVTETCIAKDCPPVSVAISPVAPLCIGAAMPVQLVPEISGGTGTGAGVWSGTGVNPATGLFNPATAGVGQHDITYTYEEDNCTYEGSTTIVVFSEPTANFTATSNLCITDAAAVTYSGNASNAASFTWDFGGGTATPGTGPGPHSVTWPDAGDYEISLSVEQDGCTSTEVIQSVQVDPTLEVPDIDCVTTTESIEFNWNTVANATDYEVAILAGQTGTQTAQTSYLVDGLVPGDEVTLQLTVTGNTVCPPVVTQATCIAQDCPPVTLELTPVAPVCLTSLAEQVNLEVIITGGSPAGTGLWSGPGVVDPVAGIFDPAVAGAGMHLITFNYVENNCPFDGFIQIQVGLPPVANAGQDATLTCKENQTDAELGGNSSSVGPNIVYDWDADFGAFPGDSTILHPVVNVPGTYTLTVTNTLFGCETSDEVVVSASQDVPVPQISITPISCFGKKDGAITVTAVNGGLPPYLFSLNGSAFSSAGSFAPLSPGKFELTILDAAGCENTLTIDIHEPQELTVELIVFIEGDNVIHLGDSAQLEALITLPVDSLDLIDWEPDSLLSCDTCLNPVAYPVQTTTFSIRVESNGCADSDEATIFVRKDRPVFVPNAFSPNEDGVNDKFLIFAGPQVSRIRSFLVFNRWGETVYQYYDFQPNDPAIGWDGTHRGEKLNTAVFTWFAEVEFVDGVTELLEGDVTLMR